MNEAKATTTDSIISRLRCGSRDSILNVADEAADEIQRLREERDEARRNVCFIEAANLSFGPDGIPYHPSVAHKIAEDYGWDCFQDKSK